MGVDVRLAIPAAVAWALAAVLVGLPGAAAPAALGLFAVGAAIVGVALWRRRASPGVTRLLGALLLAVAAAGVVAAAVAAGERARTPASIRSALASGQERLATVRIDGIPFAGSGFDADASRVEATITAVAPLRLRSEPAGLARLLEARGLAVPTLLTAPADALAGTTIGSVLVLDVDLDAADPGESEAVWSRARGDALAVADPPPILQVAAHVRAALRAAARRTPEPGSALLPGLAVGDDSLVGDDLDAAMKASSLSHLTAVSGSNCALVVALAFGIAGRLRLARSGRVLAALLVLAAFVVLVTPQPSVLRAAVMSSAVLVGLLTGRGTGGLPALALAVLVLLVGDPWLARDYGFALSVLATAGILILTEPLARMLAPALGRRLALVVALPIAAQLACQPVLVLLQPSVPLFGVAANLLAEPAAPLVTVLGLAAAAVVAIAPALAMPLVWLAWLPSAWIGEVALTFADAPALGWPAGVAGALGLALAAVVGGVWIRGRASDRRSGLPRRVTRVSGLALVALLGVVFGTSAASPLVTRALRPDDWRIAACDIGQGDAVLARSEGAVLLSDTGPDPKPLATCLSELGIRRIDLLVLSHFDLDHVGGTAAVIGMVDTVFTGPPGTASDQALLDSLAAGGATVRIVADGWSGTLGAAHWHILGPVAPVPGAPPDPDAGGNDECVIVDWRDRGFSALFLGDLGEDAQRALLERGELRPVDVVKMAHHGSADQDADLYTAVHATVGLISVGVDNGYGHPTPTALHILAAAGTRAFRTDRQGMLLVRPSATGVAVWTERDGGSG